MISALVSQSRGLAVFDDGETTAALLGVESEPRVLPESELSRLLRGAQDVEAMALPGLPELRAVLRERHLREQVLHALLLVIDGQSSKALRVTAGATLARLAVPEATARWAECILMSVPAPAEADLAGAGEFLGDDPLAAVIRRVESYQSRIRSVFAAFVSVCRKLGSSTESPLRRRAIEQGWFRALVLGERLFLGQAEAAWGFVEEWIASLVEMMSSHAVVVRPVVATIGRSGATERPDDAGWVIWPLLPETDRVIPSMSSANSKVLLEDLNLRSAERLLCEEALARAGSIPQAAQLLGITRHALERRLIKHRIEWSSAGAEPGSWGAFKATVGHTSASEQRHRRARARRFGVGRVSKANTADEA